jgi:ribosomal protein S18 acetylase RimI-like enzyme
MIPVFWYRNTVIGLDLRHVLKKTKAAGTRSRVVARAPSNGSREEADSVVVRPVRRDDLAQVIDIDATVTGLEKRSYWQSIYRRYADAGRAGRQFLVAEYGNAVVGFIIGEVRDWEFGSPPCGWVFAIDVKPGVRQSGVGSRLLEAICAGFRRAGVTKVRTMLARDNTLVLSFFRSQGMMAGRFIPLEMDVES